MGNIIKIRDHLAGDKSICRSIRRTIFLFMSFGRQYLAQLKVDKSRFWMHRTFLRKSLRRARLNLHHTPTLPWVPDKEPGCPTWSTQKKGCLFRSQHRQLKTGLWRFLLKATVKNVFPYLPISVKFQRTSWWLSDVDLLEDVFKEAVRSDLKLHFLGMNHQLRQMPEIPYHTTAVMLEMSKLSPKHAQKHWN